LRAFARNLREQLFLHEPARKGRRQHAVQQRRLAPLRLAADELARGRFGIRGKHQPVEEARAFRLVGAQRFTREHHLHRGANAGDANRAHRSAESGMDAQHDFGQADRKFVALDANAVSAGERELEAATEREPMDDSHRGAGQSFNLVEDFLRRANHLEGLRGARELREFGDVCAGNEPRCLGRADHESARRRLHEGLQMAVELHERIAREDVGRGARFVEAEPDDAVGITLERPGAGGGSGHDRIVRRRRAVMPLHRER
jgi:hypothetical protein